MTRSKSSLRSLLRREARALAPVVVKTASSELRYGALAADVVGRGAKAQLILSPVAAHALPTSVRAPVLVHSREDHWCLVANDLVKVDASVAAIPLAGASIRELPPRTRRHRTDSDRLLLLLAPSGVGDLHVLTVTDVSADICGVDSAMGLAPGTLLRSVELVGPRGSLRKGDASVLECAPWIDQHGSERFRLRVHLRKPESSFAPTESYDLVEDAARVRRVLELACLLSTPATDLESGAELTLADLHDAELAADATDSKPLGRRATIRFELFSVSYEANLRVLRQLDHHVRLTMPLFLRRRRRRSDNRTPAKPRSTLVSFIDPLSQDRKSREVIDLSFGGLSFRSTADDVVWPNLVLEQAKLIAPHHEVDLGSIEVRGEEKRASICHTALRDPSQRVGALSDVLSELRHPLLARHRGDNADELIEFIRGTELLADFMEKRLGESLSETKDNWKRLHADGNDLCRTLIRTREGRVTACVSTVQAWPGTWMGQHMIAERGRKDVSPGALFMAYLDQVLLRPDCAFMSFFTSASNERMNQIHETFGQLAGTPEAFGMLDLEIVERNENSGPTPSGQVRIRAMRPAERHLLARAAARSLGPVVAASLKLTPDDPLLKRHAKRFRRIGLARSRKIEIVQVDGLARMALVHEMASPGLSLTGLVDATWLIPLHLEREPVVGPSALAVHHALGRAGRGRLLLIPSKQLPPFSIDRYTYRHTAARYYAMNRVGLRRYTQYLAESYGELNVLRTFRVRRRVSLA